MLEREEMERRIREMEAKLSGDLPPLLSLVISWRVWGGGAAQ